MMRDIRPTHVTLAQLFRDRLFRIPEYQRSYSWRRKQRESLFKDIREVHRHGSDRSHFMATVVGLLRDRRTIGTTEHEVVEIVDGQQRITTLILLFKAIIVAIGNSIDDEKSRQSFPHGHQARSNKDQERVQKEIKDLLIKDDDATLLLLQTNHDSGDYFGRYLKEGTHAHSKDAKTIADRELLSAMEECEEFARDWQDKVELVKLLKNRLTFILHEINDESTVYTVFEVLNSRGLDVPWFDRLKSMLMATLFGHENRSELIDTIHSLWTQIYACIGLQPNLSIESLRFAATLRNPSRPGRPLSEEDAAYLLHHQSSTPKKVIDTTRWIKRVTEAVDRLTANHSIDAVTEAAQARMVATAVYMREDFTEHEKNSILRRWEKVTFRIYGLYETDTRKKVGDYVRLAWDIINEKMTSDKILKELSMIGRDFPAAGIAKQREGKDCYTDWKDELRYFLYRYERHLSEEAGQNFGNEQWNRIWVASSAKSSIEHIHPQSRWDSRDKESEMNKMHGLGNLLLLPPGLNSKLQDKSACEKIDQYARTGLLIAQEVAETVSKHGWSPKVIKERETCLLEWAAQEWAD